MPALLSHLHDTSFGAPSLFRHAALWNGLLSLGRRAACVGLGATTLALLVVWVACFAAMHAVKTGYNFVQNAVSDFGVCHASYPFAMACWNFMAVAAILLLAGLARAMSFAPGGVSSNGVAGCVFLGVFAVTRTLTSLFPVDVRINVPPEQKEAHAAAVAASPDGRPRLSRSGIIHIIVAMISFLSINVASRLLSMAFGAPGMAGSSLYAHADLLWGMWWAVLASAIAMLLAGVARRRVGVLVFGAAERLFYAAHLLWLVTAAACLVQMGLGVGGA